MGMTTRNQLLRHIVSVEESFPLQEFNALRAGGVADFFTVATNTVELAASVKAAIDLEIPYLILGQGGNVVFSDGGFPGLVIHNQAASCAFALEKSQVVVDSGITLQRFISAAAGHGLGGLTQFYQDQGTVGGALYHNLTHGGSSIMSSLRYVTMLMPPAKLDKEATIMRYKGDWLMKNQEETKLRYFKSQYSYNHPGPVILAAMFQLTSVRPDELFLRLHQKNQTTDNRRPGVPHLGPIFEPVPGHNVTEILFNAGVTTLRIGDVFPVRQNPNFITSRAKATSARDIRQLVELIQQQVEFQSGLTLKCRYEFLGVW